MVRLVIDIDGTICTQENNYINAQPCRDVIARINQLYDDGFEIVIFTARGTVSGFDWRSDTMRQLNDWGVKYHELILGKPAADFYIDDRNMSVCDFMRGIENGNDSRNRN
jgi:capsule biosynthesis phosphatase